MDFSDFLESSFVQAVGWFGFLWFVAARIRSATKEADDDLSPESRARFADALSARTANDAGWLQSFSSVFEKTFGEKHLSWLCVRRSTTISVSLFLLLGLSTGSFGRPPGSEEGLNHEVLLLEWAIWLLFPISVGLLFNGVLDYFSLWKSRLIVRSSISMTLKIPLDLLSTTFIVYAGLKFVFFLLFYFGLSGALAVEDSETGAAILLVFILLSKEFMYFPPTFGTIAFVMLATSFTVTVWVALHVAGGIMLRIVPSLFSTLHTVQRPLRAIGVASVLVLWCLGIIAFLAKLLLAAQHDFAV